jgi:hypothetical protein
MRIVRLIAAIALVGCENLTPRASPIISLSNGTSSATTSGKPASALPGNAPRICAKASAKPTRKFGIYEASSIFFGLFNSAAYVAFPYMIHDNGGSLSENTHARTYH